MSFKKYLKGQEGRCIVWTFGRFSPIHIEHELLIQDLGKIATQNKCDAVVFSSHTVNQKKNPLSFGDKIFYLRQITPSNVRVDDSNFKNSYDVLEDLIKNKGYTKIIYVVGEDRVKDFQGMYKWAKKWGDEKDVFIDFKIQQRKGKRTQGVSGTDMRQFAKDDDYDKFKAILPKKLYKYSKELFLKTRKGLGILSPSKIER